MLQTLTVQILTIFVMLVDLFVVPRQDIAALVNDNSLDLCNRDINKHLHVTMCVVHRPRVIHQCWIWSIVIYLCQYTTCHKVFTDVSLVIVHCFS